MNKILTIRQLLKSLIFPLLVLYLQSCSEKSYSKIEINQNWMFSEYGKDNWLPATVPGCVHTDLLNNGLINDPFFADNEKQLQWIGISDWEYTTTFSVNHNLLQHERINLVFEGLDTYARIFLNDSLILSADNMFRRWSIDCKNLLSAGQNRLRIHFISAVKTDSLKASKLTYKLPDRRGFTRKAPYQYGWDWGPRFITSGIWRSCYLEAWNEIKINTVHVRQNEIAQNAAHFTAVFEIESTKDREVEITIQDMDNNRLLKKTKVSLSKGYNNQHIDFKITDPKRWWTKGLGEPYLYKLNFKVQSESSADKFDQKIGIRTIELVQQPDSIGKSFYFKLNGQPVFMKGSNYIPQDNFLSRISPAHYERIIQSVVEANMNILRVWGGGIYEHDYFYDLCDENGILIWQDFMFACNMYPGDSAFVENVKQEAIQNIKRLRNHPSLALWCGNNEVDEGWHNWGWQKSLGYSKKESAEIWDNYLNIFEQLLPDLVRAYSPDISYISTSPRIGWGHKEALREGDMHYWGVWWGEEPFSVYEKKIGRFMSEYGFQGFPDPRTINQAINVEDRHLKSPAILNHQKHPRGMELIDTYMERSYHKPERFEHYAYVSQLLQAYGIKTAIEAHRRAKPYCMGTLYWQLNDCWPVISWSGIDYYGRWKAQHYFVKKAYADILISIKNENERLKVFIISDKTDSFKAELEISVIDFKGGLLWHDNIPVTISCNSSEVFANYDIKLLARNMEKSSILFEAKLRVDGNIIAESHFYFKQPKELELPNPEISSRIMDIPNGYRINLKSDKLVKNIWLNTNADGFFTDNYFDILPGRNFEIDFITDDKINNFENRLKILSLVDTY